MDTIERTAGMELGDVGLKLKLLCILYMTFVCHLELSFLICKTSGGNLGSQNHRFGAGGHWKSDSMTPSLYR